MKNETDYHFMNDQYNFSYPKLTRYHPYYDDSINDRAPYHNGY